MSRAYSVRDLKLLWGNSGGKCAFPGCRKRLSAEATARDSEAVIGHVSHIVADSDSGPRAQPVMPRKKRREYDNLILFCPSHHTLVDKQPNSYTSDDLRIWKTDHEKWVEALLGGPQSTPLDGQSSPTELEKMIVGFFSETSSAFCVEVFFNQNLRKRDLPTLRQKVLDKLGELDSLYLESWTSDVAGIPRSRDDIFRTGLGRLQYHADRGDHGLLFAAEAFYWLKSEGERRHGSKALVTAEFIERKA